MPKDGSVANEGLPREARRLATTKRRGTKRLVDIENSASCDAGFSHRATLLTILLQLTACETRVPKQE